MTDKLPITTAILGAAGEHYVMCQLLRRGRIAALAPAGAPDVDIIVSDRWGQSLAAVQVKARSDTRSNGGWPMNVKHETIKRPSLFYAFVEFDEILSKPPQCWIVPSADVADAITDSHSAWLSTPGRGGRAHQDNKMRKFMHDYSRQGLSRVRGWLDTYKEAWQLIGASENPE